MLNKLNIRHINSLEDTRDANCWGSTQYVLGYIEKPIWQQQSMMNEFLKNKTVKAVGRRKGDILVMRHKGELVHTAVYNSMNNWWHKPGSKAAEFATMERIHATYRGDYNEIEYRRFIGGTLEEDIKNTPVEIKVLQQLRRFIKSIYNTVFPLG